MLSCKAGSHVSMMVNMMHQKVVVYHKPIGNPSVVPCQNVLLTDPNDRRFQRGGEELAEFETESINLMPESVDNISVKR